MKKASKEIKLLAAFLLPVIAVIVLHHFATGFTIYNDGIGYYSYIRSAVIDRDLDFQNEWKFYNSSHSKFSSIPRGVNFPETKTPKGYIENIYLSGSSIMWAPFFLTAHASTILLNAFGAGIDANGYTILYEAFIGLANLVYGFLGLLIMSAWTGWTFGYGIRFLLGLSVFFALGAAETIERLKARIGMKWVYAIFALLIAANFANMTLFLLGEVTSKVPLSEIPRFLINAIL